MSDNLNHSQPRQSFLRGLSRVGKLNYEDRSQTLSHSETDALKLDWGRIGNDIKAAIRKYEQKAK